MITNTQSGTNIKEIADKIYRINTPIPPSVIPGGFSFNQYLIVDDKPLLFHTGPKRMFALVSEAISQVISLKQLSYIGLSHVEADECGALNEFLAVAPTAVPVCSRIGAMVSITDIADRAPHALQDNETLALGIHTLRWFDAPHLPHGWDCGYLMEERTKTLLCGDLFTQPGLGQVALTESDILGPSEAFRNKLDYFSHAQNTDQMLKRLAHTQPKTLACMHGSAWQGNGEALLLALNDRLKK